MSIECRVLQSISEIAPAAWDACAGSHPFVQHAFFSALETSGACGLHRGVVPRYVVLTDRTHGLVACAPAMLKWGNKREFGPEIQWLRAAAEDKCFAWPKLQVDVPFFPVMGPKLLVRPDMPRAALETTLLRTLKQLCDQPGANGMFNLMHVDDELAAQCKASGALVSCEWHSMWHNPGYENYEQYWQQLTPEKRNQFRREQKKARSHGLNFKVLKGTEISDEVLADYYEGHRKVCARYGGQPWLPASTYQAIVQFLSHQVLLMAYFDGEQFIAGGMKLREAAVMYSLQWSEMHKLDRVVFDVICHRPIEYAISQGIQRIDSGLDAAHKRYRGWQSVPVQNVHWIFNEDLKKMALEFTKSSV